MGEGAPRLAGTSMFTFFPLDTQTVKLKQGYVCEMVKWVGSYGKVSYFLEDMLNKKVFRGVPFPIIA